jgi:hypothetical protein
MTSKQHKQRNDIPRNNVQNLGILRTQEHLVTGPFSLLRICQAWFSKKKKRLAAGPTLHAVVGFPLVPLMRAPCEG